MKLFYERIGWEYVTRRYHCRAYYDVGRNQNVMVLFPFHYAVQLVWWLNLHWSRYRDQPSWIDQHIKAAVKRDRAKRDREMR